MREGETVGRGGVVASHGLLAGRRARWLARRMMLASMLRRPETDSAGAMAPALDRVMATFDMIAVDRAQTVLRYWNWSLSSAMTPALLKAMGHSLVIALVASTATGLVREIQLRARLQFRLRTPDGKNPGIHDLSFGWEHELLTDAQSRIWFSDIGNTAVGYFDPADGSSRIWPAPPSPSWSPLRCGSAATGPRRLRRARARRPPRARGCSTCRRRSGWWS